MSEEGMAKWRAYFDMMGSSCFFEYLASEALQYEKFGNGIMFVENNQRVFELLPWTGQEVRPGTWSHKRPNLAPVRHPYLLQSRDQWNQPTVTENRKSISLRIWENLTVVERRGRAAFDGGVPALVSLLPRPRAVNSHVRATMHAPAAWRLELITILRISETGVAIRKYWNSANSLNIEHVIRTHQQERPGRGWRWGSWWRATGWRGQGAPPGASGELLSLTWEMMSWLFSSSILLTFLTWCLEGQKAGEEDLWSRQTRQLGLDHLGPWGGSTLVCGSLHMGRRREGFAYVIIVSARGPLDLGSELFTAPWANVHELPVHCRDSLKMLTSLGWRKSQCLQPIFIFTPPPHRSQ